MDIPWEDGDGQNIGRPEPNGSIGITEPKEYQYGP